MTITWHVDASSVICTSYRQRQIGRSDCDIIANCGKIVLINSFCNHSMLQNISLSQLNLCWNIRTLPCSSDGVRWFSLVSDEFRGVPMNSTEFRWAPIALYSQNVSLFVSDWTLRGINEIIWVMFAIVDKPPIQDTWQNFKLSWCHGNRHYRRKTAVFPLSHSPSLLSDLLFFRSVAKHAQATAFW